MNGAQSHSEGVALPKRDLSPLDVHRGGHGACRPAGWTSSLLVVSFLWGVSWFLTAGLVSTGYAALAAASAITASAFMGLAPSAAAVAATAAAPVGSPAAATAVTVAIASVDWVDVALRTAAGLAGGGAGREQVLVALQDAAASPAANWAVRLLLVPLCDLAAGCRSAVMVVQAGLPWLGTLAQLLGAASGLGVLVVMIAPLRPYLAPVLRLIPGGRPPPATLTALRAGGVACMAAVLTGLQAHELRAPPLSPSARGAAAAAAAACPILAQQHAIVYGVLAVASDFVLPLCIAAVTAWASRHLNAGEGSPPRGEQGVGGDAREAATATPEAGHGRQGLAGPPGRLLGTAAALRAMKVLAAGRLLVDLLALAAVVSGQLGGSVSAVKLLGMLWLLQTAQQL